MSALLARRVEPARAAGLVALLALAALAGVLLARAWAPWVAWFGYHIPTDDVVRDYAVGLGWALALGIALLWAPVPRGHRKHLVVLWAAKVAVALGFMLLYEARYGSLDAFGYFQRSLEPAFPAGSLLSGTDAIARLAWAQNHVLPPSYHALKVSFAMVGLAACYVLWRGATLFLGREDVRVLYGAALFPSILFWSSILGKDPVVFLGIALLAYAAVAGERGRRNAGLVALVAGALALGLVRPWLLAIAFPALALLPLADLWGSDRPHRRAITLVLGGGAVLLSLLAMGQLFQLRSPQAVVLFVDSLARAWAMGGTGAEPPTFTTVEDLLAFLPAGAFTALFRPLPGEVLNPLLFGTLAGLEAALLLGLVLRGATRARRADFREPLVLAALLFVLTWSALYAFVSYQNLGTAVRFRLQVLPVLLALAVWLGRPRTEAHGTMDARLARVGRIVVKPFDAALAAVTLLGAVAVVAAARFAARPARGAPRLLVLDTSYTLHAVRSRGLEHSVTCRDLDGFFRRVFTVHPLVGAARDEPPANALGPVSEDVLGPRHTFLQGRVGRTPLLEALPMWNFALAQAGLLLRLEQLVRDERVSVIRASDPYWPGLLGLLLAKVHGLPLVVRIGGNYDAIHAQLGTPAYPRLFRSRRVEKAVERLVLPRADLVAAANQDNLGYALANGARPERATLFRYGSLIDPVHFTDPTPRRAAVTVRAELGLGERPYAVYVGRLEAVKHADDTVRVLAALRKAHPDLALVLVGDGRERAAIEGLARELGVQGDVVFAGNRGQAFVAEALAGASVVLSPHMGRALVEAALSGTPIVAYDLDWQGELVRGGETGELVKALDWEAMAEAADRVLADRTLAARLGGCAREAALDMMDPAKLMAHEREAYTKLLAGADAPAGAGSGSAAVPPAS